MNYPCISILISTIPCGANKSWRWWQKLRLKATVEMKGVGMCKRQRKNGSNWGGHETRQKRSGLAPFLSPCFPTPCLWGCSGLRCQHSTPILHEAVSFSLEPWCRCLAEQVRSRGTLATMHHTRWGQKGPRGVLWKHQSSSI